MSDARYYVVGDHDVWMIKFKDGEYGPCASRDEAFVFANRCRTKGSAHGASAPMCAWWMMTAASNPNGPTIGIITSF